MTGEKRTALITGSGRNIGRAIALALAKDGFNIVVNGSQDRDACYKVAGEAQRFGAEVLVAMGDVGVAENAKQIADDAIDKFGGVDVLVNNAAIRPSGGFLDMSIEEWNRVIDVDFSSAVWLARACLPNMVARNWGRIINFGGMNAMQGYASRPHVTVAKHAAWGLTKTLAREFGPNGITANIISPGPIAGERDDPAMAAHIESQKSKIPLGRLGKPEEIAATISLLVSDGGAFINGQLIQVNGGADT